MMNAARGTRGARSAAAALAGALTVAVAVAGCGGGSDYSSKSGAAPTKPPARHAVTVKIASFQFKPDPITVKAGGTVTFVNRDKAPHTAQTDLNPRTAEFDTDRLDRGDTKTVKLEHAGRFRYFCAFHRFMEGTVKVVE